MKQPQIELVNTEAHKDVKIDTTKQDIPENHVNAVVVVVGELNTLIHEYPIFITKTSDTEQYQLTAILGLKSVQNLYLDGDNWRANYLPLDVLRKPFQAYVPDPKDLSKGSIAIDIASDKVNYTKGESLFDEAGESTPYFKRIESTFGQLMGGTTYSAELLKLADDLNLLEQINLNFDLPNGKTASINGVYQFDKKAITELRGADLEKCHESGLLQVCHLALSSTINLQKLINWHP